MATAGSHGDIEPFAALGQGLRAQGHTVRVSSNTFHRARFERLGFEFAGHPTSMTEARLADILSDMGAQGPIEQLETLMRRFFFAEGSLQLEHQREIMSGADLVIVHWLDAIAQGAAEQLGIPWISVILTPGSLPSATHAPPLFGLGAMVGLGPSPHLSRWWARLWWRAADQMAEPLRVVIDKHLADLGLRRAHQRLLAPPSPHLNLVAASPGLLNVPFDWPSTVRITGDWPPLDAQPLDAQLAARNASANPRLPDDLEMFLQRHPEPVVIAFGSLGMTQRPETLDLVRTVAAQTASPIVLTAPGLDALGQDALTTNASGSTPRGLNTRDLPRNLLVTGYAPYAPLFARASCVVHHAGAGTSMLVVRAGVPSFPVPHLIDNTYWAHWLHRHGVATKPVLRRHLTASKLREGIERAHTQPGLRAQAAALSAVVRQEDGVAYATKLIEHFLEHRA
ncbi:MAG: glycosyltransferase family 1 protein [Deltaproteobacteria bacterium]|nr:glycosyltransferase family 1 protein [Deltaproteobacteria bacterium]